MEPAGCCGGGGRGCEMDGCEHCVAWMQHCYWNHATDGRRQFIIRASDGFRDSVCIPQEAASQLRNMIPDSKPIKLEAPDGHMYDVEFIKFGGIYLTTGWCKFVDANHIQEGDSILFVYCGISNFKVHIFSSSGHESSLQPPDIFTAVPPSNPHDCHALNEVVPDPAHVQMSTDFGYTTFPGTCLTQAQEKKVLELAESSMRSEIPLHVAAVNKRNANKDCYVHIPLRLLDNFKEGITIQLEAHDNKMLYSVGASKHNDDQIILQSGLSIFVASYRIQENDLIILRSKGKPRLEVRVLDTNGCEKTSCFAVGNSSNAREVREDSVEIVHKEPPLPTIIDLSSDDDEVIGKGTTASRREQRPLRGCRAKAQKMASTSSPCTKSGHKARKSNEAGLEAPMSNKPYILPQGTNLTRQQEEKIKEKVRAIRSEFPVFVKLMTAQSVCRPVQALNFCREYVLACRLPDKGTPLLLRLEGSKMAWPTVLLVMKHNNVRRIHKGWWELVSQAGMKAGDICLIELADRSSKGLAVTVHLIRKSEMQL